MPPCWRVRTPPRIVVMPVNGLSLMRVVAVLPERVKLRLPDRAPAKVPPPVEVSVPPVALVMKPPTLGTLEALARAATTWLFPPKSTLPPATVRL